VEKNERTKKRNRKMEDIQRSDHLPEVGDEQPRATSTRVAVDAHTLTFPVAAIQGGMKADERHQVKKRNREK
jgi:hypothetical protein